ncbi:MULTISPECIES: HAD family hydrolase [Comamonas]|jgi:phosphoglycolate phosphatase|uniref:5'-nucleotidase n=1 Tax=Comamonas aquatica TaxID=225991 RepID=A0A1B2D641_9BURK|nr:MULTISPECIES: HAD-IA family hydrolase [Comamonas]ANY63172.1 HAD family hydrolase [Comamonas aquatica]MDE1555946.1 HAD-IA family hydrolase [Comamonas aquatica]MDH0370664.1 HAD-IA family hydrolase [Comamonas aquatica]MDH0380322.1 HAD-IA family hydrolase [Comamonas aquatica]MDH0428342.1 HAD-IA family hydrolase [Comamonas aquatica]
MSARKFDLIAFDWDGTLFDSTAAITRSIQLAVADVGGTVPSDAQASYVIGMALLPALAHAAPDVPQEKYNDLANRYRYHYLKQQELITLFAGVLPMLEALRERGHWLAVATGKSRRGLNEALQHADLRGMFDSSRTADETAGKPHPLMLQELMAELDVPPERLLMIGDTTHDLQMARNAGCASVAVAYGAHDPRDLQACQPLHVAADVADLHQWLRSNA